MIGGGAFLRLGVLIAGALAVVAVLVLALLLGGCAAVDLDDLRPERIRIGWSVALPVVAAPGVMPRIGSAYFPPDLQTGKAP